MSEPESQQQTQLVSKAWSGPYHANIPEDTSVSDGCGSSINNTAAFDSYNLNHPITIRVSDSRKTVQFETKIIERSKCGSRSATFPIKQRAKFDLEPHDKITFWVKQEGTEESETGDATEIAIKPKSDVYHLCDDSGNIRCNHTGATKPGTSSNGYLRATLDEVDGDWKCCDVCESMNNSSVPELTYTEFVHFIQTAIGTGPRSGTFNKHELFKIALHLFESEKALQSAIESYKEQ